MSPNPAIDDRYFASNFNTALSPENDAKFNRWLAAQSAQRGRDLSGDTTDYDLRGYWLNGGWKDTGTGHMPDTYKKPNHPTFSIESIYHGTPSPFGTQWQGGQWREGTYQPSQHMLQHTHNWEALQQYMASVEPGVRLVPPLPPMARSIPTIRK